jgi:cytochrome c-type biogenesis protein CcmF
MVPLGLALLLFTGVGPLLAWRKSTLALLVRNFQAPIIVAVLASAGLLAAGVRGALAVTSFTFCVFVLACVAVEFLRGVRARRRLHAEQPLRAAFRLVTTNKRRWGGYIVHVGVVVIIIGITGSSAFQLEGTFTVPPGESFQLGPYEIAFHEVAFTRTPRAETYEARLDIFRGGRLAATLRPAREIFPSFRDQPASEVDIHHTLAEDLYLVLLSAASDGGATFQAYLNPLVSWIWLGGAIVLLGGVVTMLPDVRERRFAAQASMERQRAAA